MRYRIIHESPGRARLRVIQYAMSMEQADLLEAWVMSLPDVDQVTVHERLCSLIIRFHGKREDLYSRLSLFSYKEAEEKCHVLFVVK